MVNLLVCIVSVVVDLTSFAVSMSGSFFSPFVSSYSSFPAKHFIVDDICCYIGSQNLYICDLAEWGVVVDDEAATKQIKKEYWDPMWEVSYTKEDVDVDAVMDGLDIDRDPQEEAELAAPQTLKPHKTGFYDDLPEDEA